LYEVRKPDNELEENKKDEEEEDKGDKLSKRKY